jgi:hypothetical protein
MLGVLQVRDICEFMNNHIDAFDLEKFWQANEDGFRANVRQGLAASHEALEEYERF